MASVPRTLSVSFSSQARHPAASWRAPAARCRWQTRSPCSRLRHGRHIGMSGQRRSPVTARQRMCAGLDMRRGRRQRARRAAQCRASSAAIASPPPLNTTSDSFGRFSRILSTSSWICGVVPIGGVAQLNFSGSALARATNSFIVFAGSSDFTTNVLGEVASSLTPMKSLCAS